MTLPPELRMPVGQMPLRPGDWRLAAWATLVAAVPPGVYELAGSWSTVSPEVPEEVVYFPHAPIHAAGTPLFTLADHGEPAQVRAFLALAVAARSALPLLLDRVAALEAELAQTIAQRDAAWEPATRRQA